MNFNSKTPNAAGYIGLTVTILESNCYIVWDEVGNCVVIDPGGDAQIIIEALEQRQLQPGWILDTHGHIDHISANLDVKARYGCSIAIHELDAPMLASRRLNLAEWGGVPYTDHEPDRILKTGEIFEYGDLKFEILHVPGHSPGSVIFYEARLGWAFDGDLVMAGGVGRYDLPGGNAADLRQSVVKTLDELPVDVVLMPGHGPTTTVAKERATNPAYHAYKVNGD